jgi:hypothetical protein
MKWHFDMGNSTEGPLGASGVVVADTHEDAFKRLKELLLIEGFYFDRMELGVVEHPVLGLHPDEYLNVYFGPVERDDITLEEWDG